MPEGNSPSAATPDDGTGPLQPRALAGFLPEVLRHLVFHIHLWLKVLFLPLLAFMLLVTLIHRMMVHWVRSLLESDPFTFENSTAGLLLDLLPSHYQFPLLFAASALIWVGIARHLLAPRGQPSPPWFPRLDRAFWRFCLWFLAASLLYNFFQATLTTAVYHKAWLFFGLDEGMIDPYGIEADLFYAGVALAVIAPYFLFESRFFLFITGKALPGDRPGPKENLAVTENRWLGIFFYVLLLETVFIVFWLIFYDSQFQVSQWLFEILALAEDGVFPEGDWVSTYFEVSQATVVLLLQIPAAVFYTLLYRRIFGPLEQEQSK